jgi:predicted DNA-binding transcriptional regulator AlpA
MNDNLMSARRVAEYLGITYEYLGILRMRGGGPPYIKIGKSVRYHPREVETWRLSKLSRLA